MARRYRTGDLYLENTWTLGSLLEHSQDPLARWSNLGMFLVEDNDDGSEEVVKVALLQNGELQSVELDELLHKPELQAAAHRSLNNRGAITHKLRLYLLSLLDTNSRISQQSRPLRKIVQSAVSNYYDPSLKSGAQTISNLGEKVDDKGNNVKPTSLTRLRNFDCVDLVSSILAYSGLASYDPDLPLSSFQQGGPWDKIYSPETPLFPRVSAEAGSTDKISDVEAALIEIAQREAAQMVKAYFAAKPRMSYAQFRNYPPRMVNAGRMPYDEADESIQTDDRYAVLAQATVYVEQDSNLDRANRKHNTIAIAEAVTSDTVDRKLRHRKLEGQKYYRPQPGYQSK